MNKTLVRFRWLFFAFTTLVITTLVVWFVMGWPRFAKDPATRETDLAILGYVLENVSGPTDKVCWLGVLGSDEPLRVRAASGSVFDKIRLYRRSIEIDERSKLESVDECLATANVVLARFPLPDMSGLPRELGARLTAVMSELVTETSPTFERQSMSFNYPGGMTFMTFRRKK